WLPEIERRAERAQRREDLFGRVVRAGDHPEHGDDGLATPLLRDEVERRRRHASDCPSDVVAPVAEIAPGADDVCALRRIERGEAAVHDRRERAELELRLRDDTEVAASASEAPEELRVLVLGRGDELAVGGDDVRPDEVVGGEAVFALEPAAAGAGGESDDPRRRDATAGD